MILRPYQSSGFNDIHDAWRSGHRNVLWVAPTGGGKTVVFSEILRTHQGQSVAIAHRQELVGQMSMALARDGVRHRIMAPMPVIKEIVQDHIEELGRDYYDPRSPCAAAGIDTLLSWAKPTSPHNAELSRWAMGVTKWITDEAHHLLTSNKWGKGVALFPNAVGLGVTATPERADGKGLGRSADGVFDHMIVGPGMRELINDGYLTDYRIICPPSDLDLSDVATGADGDYVRGQLALKTSKSSVMGDVVTHYLRWASGKLGVTFAPDVETATELAARFNAAGVPAEVVSAKTPTRIRKELLRRFKKRQILQLVNVDLFGEGFDLPAIEVASMARATQSYGLYVQQFGRVLRILEGKSRGIIIDHVGNVARHGLPDRPRVWTLNRREKRSSSKEAVAIPVKTCLNPVCLAAYEAIYPACPYCGWVPVPTTRSAPEFVDGDLYELDEATLAALRGEVAKVNRSASDVLHMMERAGNPFPVAKGAANRHAERLAAQEKLRETMAWYGGVQRALGRDDRMAQRAFFHQFGIDVMSAQALGRPDAEELMERINRVIGRTTT